MTRTIKLAAATALGCALFGAGFAAGRGALGRLGMRGGTAADNSTVVASFAGGSVTASELRTRITGNGRVQTAATRDPCGPFQNVLRQPWRMHRYFLQFLAGRYGFRTSSEPVYTIRAATRS